MNSVIIAILILGIIGCVLALVLFWVSQKFAVKEDPRLEQVSALLPGANCGGCGFPGCGGMAAACVKAADEGSLENLLCPVGGKPVMDKIAATLGVEAGGDEYVRMAVVRCNGSCQNRPQLRIFDGVNSCKVANMACQGETACAYGCLGCGDCVAKCQFGGLKMNPETGIPEADPDICTACGGCAKACPRGLIEIRVVKKDMTGMVVKCRNKDKGIVAKNACDVSCIGCKLCVKKCESGAITVEDNLAYIDATKCTMCGACEEACPRHAIQKIGVWTPLPKQVEDVPQEQNKD